MVPVQVFLKQLQYSKGCSAQSYLPQNLISSLTLLTQLATPVERTAANNTNRWGSSEMVCQCRGISSQSFAAQAADSIQVKSDKTGTTLGQHEGQAKHFSPPMQLPTAAAPQQSSAQKTKAAYIPWTFSRHLAPMRHVANRMGFLMECLEREQLLQASAGKMIDDFRAGDVLEVRMKVPEAGGAEYLFKGLCIARYNKGIRSAFKLYNVYPESGGIVQHIPLYMPDLLSVKVVDHIPVRRNKLYYMLRQQKGSSYQNAPLPAIPAGTSATKPQAAAVRKGGAKKAKKSK